MAAAARPVSPRLGHRRRRKELDTVAIRPAARTRRPAIDAGRGDGIHEQAVSGAVTGRHSVPKGLGVHWSLVIDNRQSGIWQSEIIGRSPVDIDIPIIDVLRLHDLRLAIADALHTPECDIKVRARAS